MDRLLIYNIKGVLLEPPQASPRSLLKGEAMQHLHLLDDAYLTVTDGRITDLGRIADIPAEEQWPHRIDARRGYLLPAWCDSHTHLVFAGSREQEFVDRIHGLSYEEIARRGGGILHSAERLRQTPEDVLFEEAWLRLEEISRLGTGAVEIKSGYGLSMAGELKMLRVIRRLREKSSLLIKATFLGAHALPAEFRHDRSGYLHLLLDTLLPQIADEGLADYIDVFCEKGFFTPEETDRILDAGARYGLRGKIHTNQFNSLGGIEAALRRNALSVDHLEVLTEEEIGLLRRHTTIPTLLPSAPFFLNDPYPPARKMIDAGLGVALATDYNPGSSPSGNMSLVLSLACLKMGMTPAEAFHAATYNGACAMECLDQVGSIAPGKRANLILTHPIPSLEYLPYAFGSNHISQVLLEGKPI